METPILLLAMILGKALPPPPTPVCIAATGESAEAVELLRGEYRVMASINGRLVAGEATLSGADGSTSLVLAGDIDGSPRRGTARYVQCGPDRTTQLEIALASGQTLYCVPHSDYDNLNRASCSPSLSDPGGDHELWVEKHTP